MASQSHASVISKHTDVNGVPKCRQYLPRCPRVTSVLLSGAKANRSLGSQTAGVCCVRDLRWFLPRRCLGEHPLDYRCFVFVLHKLLRIPVSIVTERHTAGDSQMARFHPFSRFGDAGGDHLALKF